MKSKLHAFVGALALLCVVSFWSTTLISEIFLSHAAVAAIKNAILAAMWLFVPAMAATGGSGFALAKGRGGRLVEAKKRRMKFIAANGILVLLPSAFALASMANAGRFDAVFYAVQVLELVAGAVNITLLSLNMRDGLRMTGRLRPAVAARNR
jgi:hypothetical protein